MVNTENNGKNDLISIKEYAEQKGCSTQAVYKKLSTSLQPYVVELQGKKYLKIEALRIDEEKSLQPSFNPLSTPKVEKLSTVDNPSEELKSLSEEVERLKSDKQKEVEKLEAEIEFLKEQLKKSQEREERTEEERRQLFAVNVQLNNRILQIEQKEEVIEEAEEKRGFFSWFKRK